MSAADPGPFRQMAHNNAWANYRLLAACSALSQDEFEARRTNFFPSLKATLNHILVVDWFYVDAMEGGTLGPAAWQEDEPCATMADLMVRQRAVDRRLIDLCADLTAERLTSIVRLHREDRVQCEPLHRVLLHLFHHQTHHRGQAHAMLAGTSVRPPQIDEFFLKEEAGLRVEDFQALDFKESVIWPAD